MPMYSRRIFVSCLLSVIGLPVLAAPTSDLLPERPRIIGGDDAQPGDWPFMGALVSQFNAVDVDLSVAGVNFDAEAFSFGPAGQAQSTMADCGLAGEVCENVDGQICVIERGEFNFSVKAENCERGGGVGAIIYNNADGNINGTLGADFSGTIPVVAVTRDDGLALLADLDATAFISVDEQARLQQRASCGATFLGDKWMLTAAHCVDSGFASLLSVNVGEYDLSDGASDAVEIADIYLHPDYQTDEFDYDIAIVELSRSFSQPAVTLADKALTDQLAMENSPATVIGWGGRVGYPASGGDTSDFPDLLQEVELQLFTNEQCRAITAASLGRSDTNVGVTDRMICAGEIGGGQGSCQGDSGGPLLVFTNGEWQQVGIVSWGRGCAADGFPGVYSRVGEFEQFVASVTQGLTIQREQPLPVTPVGSTSTGSLRVVNNSGQTVPVQLITGDSEVLNIDSSGCPQLENGQSCSLEIRFSPQTNGVAELAVAIDTQALGVPGNQLTLTAQGLAEAPQIGASAGPLSSALTWFSGGDTAWQANSVSGLESGDIADAQESILMARVTGAGQLNFDWSVSSEANSVEPDDPFDALYLFVNGELRDVISGEVPFTSVSVELSGDENLVEWTYSKDASVSEGQDKGFVTNVVFTPDSGTPAPQPQPTSPPTSSGGGTLTINILLCVWLVAAWRLLLMHRAVGKGKA